MTGRRPWLDGWGSCTHSCTQHLTRCFVCFLEILLNGSSQEHWLVLGSSGAWSLSSSPRSPLPAALTVTRVAGLATGPHLHWVFLPQPRSPPGWCLNPGPKSCLEDAFALPPRFSLRGSPGPSRGRLLVFASGCLGFGLCTYAATQGFSDPVVCGFLLALLPQNLSSLQT